MTRPHDWPESSWTKFPADPGGGRAIEDAVDLDGPVLVERLAAVLDRLEERLRGHTNVPGDEHET